VPNLLVAEPEWGSAYADCPLNDGLPPSGSPETRRNRTFGFVTRRTSLSLCTDGRNERSRRAIETLGARFEGVRRADRPGADGAVRDSAVYSIIAPEWPQVRLGLERRLTTVGEPADDQ
jgi:hypothetical protein